jgi:hypothetical protein
MIFCQIKINSINIKENMETSVLFLFGPFRTTALDEMEGEGILLDLTIAL